MDLEVGQKGVKVEQSGGVGVFGGFFPRFPFF